MRLYDEDKRKAFYESYNAKIAELDKSTKAKCLTSLIFCMKAIVMLRWIQTTAGQFMKSSKIMTMISYMVIPAEKTVQNSLISKIVKDGIDSGDGFSWC